MKIFQFELVFQYLFLNRQAECETCASLGFQPVQNDEINFLDVTNKGFEPGMNPNQASNQLWKDLEQRIQKYIRTAATDRDEL